MVTKKIFSYISHPLRLIMPLERRRLLTWMPDKTFLKLAYKSEMGFPLDLNNPLTYSQKIQWTKLYDRNPIYPVFADKFAVRTYVTDTIGDNYLIPLIQVYNTVEEINWDELPNEFVLKCTHGSKSNILCTDKLKLNIEETKLKLNNWMERNWFWFGREWAYKSIKPRIICEKLLKDPDNQIPNDIKVKCFNGQPKIIDIHSDRFGAHYLNTYDTKWKPLNYNADLIRNKTEFQKPKYLDELLELSKKLAKETIISRIDWYYTNNQLYFGEITLYEASGFVKKGRYDADLAYGQMIQLPLNN